MSFNIGEIVKLSRDEFSWGRNAKRKGYILYGQILELRYNILYKVKVLNGDGHEGNGWSYLENELEKANQAEVPDDILVMLI